MAEGLDADFDRSLEGANLFLARPRATTNGRGDDVDRRSHFWVSILAGFRTRYDFSYSGCWARFDVGMERDERRIHLRSRAIRRLDNSFACNNRRENPTSKRTHGHFSAAPCVLPSRECSDLDGDS